MFWNPFKPQEMKTEKYLYDKNNNPIISTQKTPVDLLFIVIESVDYNLNKAGRDEFFKLDACGLYSEQRLSDYTNRVNKANEDAIANDVVGFRMALYRINQQNFNFNKGIKII